MSDVQSQEGNEQGNVPPSSEQNSGDATQSQQSNQPPAQSTSSSPSNPTDTSAGTASDASSTSQSDSSGEAGNGVSGASTATDASGTSAPAPDAPIVTGTIVPGNVVTPAAPVSPVAPAVTPDVPAVVQKEESVVLDAIQTGISDVDQIVERLMKDTGIEAKIIINTIKEYIVTMKPGKIVAQKVAIGQQVAFYNAILGAINNLESDFRPTMQSILALLHAHKDGAFKETHIFRHIDSVPLSKDHRTGWRKLTTLLKTLANPATRQDLLRQMNFDPLVKHGLSERGRTKLAAFFGK